MSENEIIRAWKDPESRHLADDHPVGDIELAELMGGLAPTANSACAVGSCILWGGGC
jgi:hypothetical protein